MAYEDMPNTCKNCKYLGQQAKIKTMPKNCLNFLGLFFFFGCFSGVCLLIQWLYGTQGGPEWFYQLPAAKDGRLLIGGGVIAPCVVSIIGAVVMMIVFIVRIVPKSDDD